MGILTLVPYKKNQSSKEQSMNAFQIRMPYLWMSKLVTASEHPGMRFWQDMLNYDEPMYWQNFEDFNAKFFALRLNLFRLAGYSKVSLREFLRGANISRHFPEVHVILPESVKLCRLKHRYPRGML